MIVNDSNDDATTANIFPSRFGLNTSLDYKVLIENNCERLATRRLQQRITDLDIPIQSRQHVDEEGFNHTKEKRKATNLQIEHLSLDTHFFSQLISAIFGYYIIKKNNMQRMKFIEQISNLRIGNIHQPHIASFYL